RRRPGAVADEPALPRLGAGRRSDPGVRHGRLRRARRRGAARPCRAARRSDPRRRPAGDRVARRRPGDDDGADGDQLHRQLRPGFLRLSGRVAPEIVTFGCRLNAYESEAMRRLAAEAGLADAIIVNTCAVTAEAERQARQAVRRLRREHPSARLSVTGCAAQIDPARWAAMPEVSQVLGNAEKLRRESWGLPDRIVVGDVMAVRETASHLVE